MANFQHHETSGMGGGRRSPEQNSNPITTTQYGTSHLDQQYSSFDSCSCPGTNCLYPLSGAHQQNVLNAASGPAVSAAGDPRYPLLEERPRRSAQAFSTFTSLMIVFVATCLMLFLAHTFFSILYYGTYDFRRGSNMHEYAFEKDETAELIETDFTQMTHGQEIGFKKDDVCLEPCEEAHQFLDFRRAIEANKEELKILNLPTMRALEKVAEEDNKKKSTTYTNNNVHTYNVGGRRWPSA